MSATATISADVFSIFRRQYAKRGDIVAVIADHGNVLVVEGRSGRFPVSRQYIIITTPSHELERENT